MVNSRSANSAMTAQVPNLLRDRLYEGSAVAYVGAGFSMACGMPGWKGFLEVLLKRAKYRHSTDFVAVRTALDEGDLVLAASILTGVLNADDIDVCLNDQFGEAAFGRASEKQRERMQKRMRCLVEASWAGIVTTNYDGLIEKAIGQLDGNWIRDTQNHGDHSRMGVLLSRPGDLFYQKLHGTLSAGRIVLTTEDYDATYLRSPQVSTFLMALMLRYHLVFIGCSLEDEIIRIRRKLVGDFERMIPSAFALLERNAKNEARDSFLSQYANIETIWYTSSDGTHTEVDDFLEALALLPKKPEAIRFVQRYSRLEDRLSMVGESNQALVRLIGSTSAREMSTEDILQKLDEDSSAKEACTDGDLQKEVKYRLLYLVSVGLLYENMSGDTKVFSLPPALGI